MSATNYYKEITQQLDKEEIDKLIKLLTLYNNKEHTITSQIMQITYLLKDNTTLNISNDEIIQRVLAKVAKVAEDNFKIAEDKINLFTHDGDY